MSEYVRAKNPRDAEALMVEEQRELRFGMVPPEDLRAHLAAMQERVEAAPFRFAKSMPSNPHWYTLREEWGDEEFTTWVTDLRRYGVIRHFRGWPYIHLDLGDFTYWTMGWPADVTTVLNRKPL